MPQLMPEATILRNYLDWVLALPWNELTEDRLDIKGAHAMLEADHYGLEKVKNCLLYTSNPHRWRSMSLPVVVRAIVQ